MKYAIFQVDNTRQHYVDAIRNELSQDGEWDEVDVWCVDGRDPEQLAKAQDKWKFPVNIDGWAGRPTVGQLGIWYTVLNALEAGVEVTFEDDAILLPHFFNFEFHSRLEELPGDADFFSLFVPRNHDDMLKPRHDIGQPRVVRAYHPYGGVSMYWPEKGKEKFLSLVEQDGLFTQWDNQLYGYSWAGKVNGYTSKWMYPELVRITGHESSIVHETERL